MARNALVQLAGVVPLPRFQQGLRCIVGVTRSFPDVSDNSLVIGTNLTPPVFGVEILSRECCVLVAGVEGFGGE